MSLVSCHTCPVKIFLTSTGKLVTQTIGTKYLRRHSCTKTSDYFGWKHSWRWDCPPPPSQIWSAWWIRRVCKTTNIDHVFNFFKTLVWSHFRKPWIRIQGSSGSGSSGLKTKKKVKNIKLSQHNFTFLWLFPYSFSFFVTLQNLNFFFKWLHNYKIFSSKEVN